MTGDLNSSSECDDTVFVNNNGDNFKAFFTIRANPTFTPPIQLLVQVQKEQLPLKI
ncbi:hypothetical protein H9X57_12895 [Flavobacterium piscinae]|uniref:hypothetical protein n=1 Tax=Flavobacterium piscinae TaxID=2506424 RepID=UPI0019C76EEA|nr:hypothetical protein [Flavobacterium piscinae]MBC8883927.1 hypothetical protein [Flavobacterium piscinae]